MHLSFQIVCSDLPGFLGYWSSRYDYPDESKYTSNIGKPLTHESLRTLFEWKNGTGSGISGRKLRSITENYPLESSGDLWDRYLDHRQPGGAIWNIFYLHCLDPEAWPIFDQHTFRAMHYIETGRIAEIGTTSKQKYEAYQHRYIPFVRNLGNLDQRTVDKALFTFGRFLKAAGRFSDPASGA